jgi:hypothetical protein
VPTDRPQRFFAHLFARANAFASASQRVVALVLQAVVHDVQQAVVHQVSQAREVPVQRTSVEGFVPAEALADEHSHAALVVVHCA